MKKIVLAALVLALSLSLCACAAASGSAPSENTAPPRSESDPPVTVSPLPASVDISALESCTLPARFELAGISADESGKLTVKLGLFEPELFDLVDISRLRPGDSIVLAGVSVRIESLERDEAGSLIINGGLDMGGSELRTDESGVFYEVGYNDALNYIALGEALLPVSEAFVFTDASDPDAEPRTYTAAGLMAASEEIMPWFVPSNTEVRIEKGEVVSMERRYIP